MKAAGLGITAAVLAAILKKQDGEQALLLGIVAAAMILSGALTNLAELTGFFRKLTTAAGISLAWSGPVLKSVGLALAGKLSSEVCRDAGQSATATALELASSAAILCVSLPLLQALIESVFHLT